MSDEYETTETTPSIFWPLLVLVLALVIWAGYQDFAVNAQRSVLKQNLTDAGPIYQAAVNWRNKYNSIMQDLNETGKKDPYAEQILRLAIPPSVQAGLVNVPQQTQGTNSTANPAAPTSSAPASGAANSPAK